MQIPSLHTPNQVLRLQLQEAARALCDSLEGECVALGHGRNFLWYVIENLQQ